MISVVERGLEYVSARRCTAWKTRTGRCLSGRLDWLFLKNTLDKGEKCFCGENRLGYWSGTVPAQCPHSARDSARLEFIAAPAVY